MSLLEKVDHDLTTAMKEQDKFTMSVLRMLKSEFITESRKGSLHDLNDDDAIKVIKRQVKTRKDSIVEYEKYEKKDEVEKLTKEIEVLNKYLPEEMSKEDIEKVVEEIFNELKPESIKDMGKVMKEATARIGASADMSLVSSIVKEKLS